MVNCSTTCPDPGPGEIETQVGRGPQWKEFLLEDVTENAILQCFFSCAGTQKYTSLGITVYKPPEQVILEPQPAWVAVDEDFTVKCHVPTVVPLENLTLTLLQGDQELHRKNFPSLAVASQRAEVTISDRARREDDRCNFSCRAVLGLSTHGGGLFCSSSAVRVLWTFEFFQSPQIWVSLLLETVSCEVARVFPAKEVVFRMFLGDQELSPFLSWEGDTAWANASVQAVEPGEQELTYLVSLGPMEQKRGEPVHIYSLDEGISSTIFIIIVALGVAVLTLALCLNYQPCKTERQKLPSKQKEKNKGEESQFAVQQAEECNAHNC
ncbi:Intercellular Adhesion Molecule 2 [Manis pentadactyla]|nr:Intercellular Adhesion Molecule 2 [Manis pentadactyla]